MLTHASAAPGARPVPQASPVSPDDVPLLRHPGDEPARHHLDRLGLPRVLVVDPDAAPPIAADRVEDWVRAPVDPDELAARRRTVLDRYHRASLGVRIDGDGLLRAGDRWIDLPDRQRAVLFPLVNQLGRPVSRAVVVAEYLAAGGTDAQALPTVIHRLRARLSPLGLVLHTLHQGGFLLEGPPAVHRTDAIEKPS